MPTISNVEQTLLEYNLWALQGLEPSIDPNSSPNLLFWRHARKEKQMWAREYNKEWIGFQDWQMFKRVWPKTGSKIDWHGVQWGKWLIQQTTCFRAH